MRLDSERCDDKVQAAEPLRPHVSVVVVTKGRHESAAAAVASILRTNYPAERRQIIVVEETLRPRPISGIGVEYHTIPEENRGVAFARNHALRYVSNEIVAFTDDDCLVEEDWLEELTRPLMDDPEVGASAGAVLIPQCGPIGKSEHVLGFPGGGARYLEQASSRILPMKTFSTCNCAARAAVISEMGGFQKGFYWSGEDEMLSRKISRRYRLLYTPFARVYHRPRDSLKAVFTWFMRRGRDRVNVIRLQEVRRLTWTRMAKASPVVRLTGVILLSRLAGVSLLPVLLAAGGLYYLLLIWKYAWSLKYYRDWRVLAVTPVVRTTMDIALDVGTLIELTFPKKPE